MGGSNHDPTLHPHCQNHCRHRNRNRRGHRNPHRDQGGLEHGLEGGYAEPYHGAGKAPSPQPPSRALQRWQPRLLPSRESTKIPETGPGEEHEEHEEREECEECEEWALPAVSGACGRALTALQKALLTRLRILRWAPRLSEGIGIGIGMELAAETRVVAAEMRVVEVGAGVGVGAKRLSRPRHHRHRLRRRPRLRLASSSWACLACLASCFSLGEQGELAHGQRQTHGCWWRGFRVASAMRGTGWNSWRRWWRREQTMQAHSSQDSSCESCVCAKALARGHSSPLSRSEASVPPRWPGLRLRLKLGQRLRVAPRQEHVAEPRSRFEEPTRTPRLPHVQLQLSHSLRAWHPTRHCAKRSDHREVIRAVEEVIRKKRSPLASFWMSEASDPHEIH